MHDLFLSAALSTIITPCLFIGMASTFAQVMQSASYRIESDSINVGGGLSTSSNYTLESTAGEIATGDSASPSFRLKAGYQQMREVFISMTDPGSISLSPSISGISGGSSDGTATVTIITDGAAGYMLTIEASQSPAMQKGGDVISDYAPGGDPDFNFTIGPTDAHFGYSPSGVDIIARFKDDTATCNSGSTDTPLACWDGLSTSPVVIAQSGGPNHPEGATTTIHFRVGIGGSVVQPPGTYTATTTLTALPL